MHKTKTFPLFFTLRDNETSWVSGCISLKSDTVVFGLSVLQAPKPQRVLPCWTCLSFRTPIYLVVSLWRRYGQFNLNFKRKKHLVFEMLPLFFQIH